jgi:hypothetical protein
VVNSQDGQSQAVQWSAQEELLNEAVVLFQGQASVPRLQLHEEEPLKGKMVSIPAEKWLLVESSIVADVLIFSRQFAEVTDLVAPQPFAEEV